MHESGTMSCVTIWNSESASPKGEPDPNDSAPSPGCTGRSGGGTIPFVLSSSRMARRILHPGNQSATPQRTAESSRSPSGRRSMRTEALTDLANAAQLEADDHPNAARRSYLEGKAAGLREVVDILRRETSEVPDGWVSVDLDDGELDDELVLWVHPDPTERVHGFDVMVSVKTDGTVAISDHRGGSHQANTSVVRAAIDRAAEVLRQREQDKERSALATGAE